MTTQFLGEIRAVGFNYAPRGWALCNGQLLPISQNTALFSLVGTYYGGDGQTTFALPDLRGASPLGAGSGAGLTPRAVGEHGGVEQVTLLESEMPPHTHSALANDVLGNVTSPIQARWARPRVGRRPEDNYAPTADVTMHPQSLGLDGGNLPHNNMPPYQVQNFIIALNGIFPSRP